MKFSSDASIKVLEYAQRREAESRDFYRECLDKATIPGTKQILRGLVEDEERHYTIVTGMLAEAKTDSGVKEMDTAEPAAAKAVFETAFPHKMAGDKGFSAESAGVGDMLKKALDNEKESFENYSRAAQNAEEPELKEIYDFLAKEENKHYVLIDNLVDFLDDPDKWIYEEENLIFRL